MQQVTVGTKYQIVIPKAIRKKVKGLKPGAKVVVRTLDDETIAVKRVEKNWIEATRGLAKEAWKGIDTTKYLKGLRDEWNRKS